MSADTTFFRKMLPRGKPSTYYWPAHPGGGVGAVQDLGRETPQAHQFVAVGGHVQVHVQRPPVAPGHGGVDPTSSPLFFTSPMFWNWVPGKPTDGRTGTWMMASRRTWS